jgi:hypothetical protein
MRELFVYWRLERHDLAAASLAMQRFQATLEADWPGLVARLYERADDAGSDTTTLMETYARDGGIAPGLQADIVALGNEAAGRWCRGPRHVEVFDALPR